MASGSRVLGPTSETGKLFGRTLLSKGGRGDFPDSRTVPGRGDTLRSSRFPHGWQSQSTDVGVLAGLSFAAHRHLCQRGAAGMPGLDAGRPRVKAISDVGSLLEFQLVDLARQVKSTPAPPVPGGSRTRLRRFKVRWLVKTRQPRKSTPWTPSGSRYGTGFSANPNSPIRNSLGAVVARVSRPRTGRRPKVSRGLAQPVPPPGRPAVGASAGSETRAERRPTPNRAGSSRPGDLRSGPRPGRETPPNGAPHVAPSASAPGSASPAVSTGLELTSLNRAELRPRESPGARPGNPARSRGETPTGSARRRTPNRRRESPGGWPPGARADSTARARSILGEPVRAPLPHVPRHVADPVRRVAQRIDAHRRRMADASVKFNRARVGWLRCPTGTSAPSVPRAARSHSASVGRRKPAQAQNAAASHQLTLTTGETGYGNCDSQSSGCENSPNPPAFHQRRSW